MKLENKRFFVNKIGLIVSDRLIESFNEIMDYDFTANLENELDEIASGNLEWKSVLNKFYHCLLYTSPSPRDGW